MRPLLTLTCWLLLLPLAGCFDASAGATTRTAASEAEKRAYQEIPAALQAEPRPWPLRSRHGHRYRCCCNQTCWSRSGSNCSSCQNLKVAGPAGAACEFLPEWIDVVVQDPKQSSYYEKYRWQDGRSAPGLRPGSKSQSPGPDAGVTRALRIAAQVYQQVLAEAAKLEGSGPIRFISFQHAPS